MYIDDNWKAVYSKEELNDKIRILLWREATLKLDNKKLRKRIRVLEQKVKVLEQKEKRYIKFFKAFKSYF